MIVVSSFRSCSAHFVLSSSNSISSPSYPSSDPCEFLPHRRFQAADFSSHVGFADPQHLADFTIGVAVEIEKNQRLVQFVQSLDELVEKPDVVRIRFGSLGYVEQALARREDIARSR